MAIFLHLLAGELMFSTALEDGRPAVMLLEQWKLLNIGDSKSTGYPRVPSFLTNKTFLYFRMVGRKVKHPADVKNLAGPGRGGGC